MKLQDQKFEKDTKKFENENVKQLRSILRQLFPKQIFKQIEQRDSATWKPYLLAACAFLWMACNEKNLVDAFRFVHSILFKIFTTITKLGSSYQGFMDQLGRYNAQLMNVILPHFRNLTKTKLKNYWLTAGFLLLGVDGSRFQLPRTKSLIEAFAPKKKNKETKRQFKERLKRYKKKQSEKDRKKKSESPQLWLTLLWHVGTGLPYHWRIGPSDSSEREHALSMFADLPPEALIVADAGFIGYEFWSSMIDADRRFVVRVGGNVRLLRKLGWSTKERKDTVYLWPKGKRDKNPPLVLRLIRIHDGRGPLCLVTNLAEEKLSVESALEIYRRRWGIEVFFRTLKQTFDRRKLRSKGSSNAPLELEWSLVTLWGMSLIGEEWVQKSGVGIECLSPSKVLKSFSDAIRDYRVDPEGRKERLFERLRNSLLDDYERSGSKTNREYPRQSQKKKLHEPVIEIASKTTKKQAKDWKSSNSVT
jgi:hypothetical protein